MVCHWLLTSSVDAELSTSQTSVITPKVRIAVRKDVAERLVLVSRSRLDKRHSSIEAKTSLSVPDMLRLWKARNTDAEGEGLNGETGISHRRKSFAVCSMLSNEPDVSRELPEMVKTELAMP